jgi:hypothetical protein
MESAMTVLTFQDALSVKSLTEVFTVRNATLLIVWTMEGVYIVQELAVVNASLIVPVSRNVQDAIHLSTLLKMESAFHAAL